MAEAMRDRLLPSLLDRLTDDEPGKRSEAREFKVLSLAQLRRNVLRDLNWLLNATRHDTHGEAGMLLDGHPAIRSSVMNFGLPGISGYTATSAELSGIERSLREAILAFEPRLIAETVQVRSIVEKDETKHHHNRLKFRIQAQLWAQPAPIELLIQTDLDLESGQHRVSEVGR